MTRYHPILVALHWLMALFIIIALVFGAFVLDPIPDNDPAKAEGLAGHMTVGALIAALLVVRLITRFGTETPPHATAGNAVLDKVGVATHWLLYILVALMVLSGMATARAAGLPDIVFGGGTGEIVIPEAGPRVAHGIVSRLLMLVLALHIAAALYHQFIRKDGLFRRMWFGKRTAE